MVFPLNNVGTVQKLFNVVVESLNLFELIANNHLIFEYDFSIDQNQIFKSAEQKVNNSKIFVAFTIRD